MSAPILLLGNPNSGKTTLFNALTGLNAKVANFPGVTVEARVGEITRLGGEKVSIVDLPGTYSLIPTSEEEELTIKAMLGDIGKIKEHSLVVVVVDCTELRRGLYLYSQVIELGFKAMIALSMADQQTEDWQKKAVKALKREVNTQVVAVSANDKESITRLLNTIDGILAGSFYPQIRGLPLLFKGLPESLQEKLGHEGPEADKLPLHAQKSLELSKNHNIYLYGLAKRGRLGRSAKSIEHLELDADDVKVLDQLLSEIPEERFKRVDEWIKTLEIKEDKARKRSDIIDRVLLQPILGSIFLLALFISMLQGLFLVAKPLADLLDDGIGYIGNSLGQLMPAESVFRSLLVDGIFAGVGSILSFLPLIGLLFLFLAILDDSGYMARATYLLDANLKRAGLCGRSLMPMLSSFACAVPAIMAARTIGNRKERLITILVVPFLTCSARLPVFALIVGALFSSYPPLFGVIDMGALIFVSMYALGLLASLISAFILSKVLKADHMQSLAIELPPYRWPNPLSIGKRVFDRIYLFVRDVGSVILASTVVIWALFHFEPYHPPSAEAETVSVHAAHSYAGHIGKAIEPLVAPMGFDWQVGVGILASFLAREVFVSTMGVVYGFDKDSAENVGLKQAFKERITPLAGISLLIFFTLSMQCVSTMATTRRETGSLLWPLLQFLIMSGSGYLLSVLVYSAGRALGWA